MKKLILMITALVTLFTTDIYAWDFINANIGGGARYDTLEWQTFPNSTTPTRLKEKWHDLNIYTVNADFTIHLGNCFVIAAEGDYGWIPSGNQEITIFDIDTSDNILDTRDDFTASSRGHVYDYSVGAGLQGSFFQDTISLGLLGGYAYNYMKVLTGSFDFSVNTDNFNLLNFHNYYLSHFKGPWVGIFTSLKPVPQWIVNVGYAYHYVRFFDNVTDQFIIGGPVITLRSHHLHGNEFRFGMIYKLNCNFELGGDIVYKYYSIDKGNVNFPAVGTAVASKQLRYRSTAVVLKIGCHY